MMIFRAAAAFLILSGVAIAQVAQPGARHEDAKPQFEVASIRAAAPGSPAYRLRLTFAPGGRLTVPNYTVKELIALAWEIQPFRISGGPAWIDSIRYNVSAKADHDVEWKEATLMLQSPLTDRFQLTMHRESKDLPIYALVLAKKDGKLGPRLIESKEDGCTKADPSALQPEPGKAPKPQCDMLAGTFRRLKGTSVPPGELALAFGNILGRMVVDKTGLTGNFDIDLAWTPDDTQYLQLPPGVPAPPPSDGPSIFVALQEQLGLKLESQKGPVEVFVIDRAEKPSEN
jgi:uncharacterized protein (TIGR03435 family)